MKGLNEVLIKLYEYFVKITQPQRALIQKEFNGSNVKKNDSNSNTINSWNSRIIIEGQNFDKKAKSRRIRKSGIIPAPELDSL